MRAGYWVGFGEHCGDAMTHKILDHDTQKIIYRSAVRPKKSSTPNHRLAPHVGEVSASSNSSQDKFSSGSPVGSPEGSPPKKKAPRVFIRSRDEENPSGSKPMPMTEFRQPLQVQSHLEMPRILVQLGHTQRTQKLAPQTDPKWSPTWSLTRFQPIYPLSARDRRYACQGSRAHHTHSRL